MRADDVVSCRPAVVLAGVGPMAIPVGCGCGEWFGVGAALSDRRVRCPGCGRGVVVPRPMTALLVDEDEDGADGVAAVAPARPAVLCVLARLMPSWSSSLRRPAG